MPVSLPQLLNPLLCNLLIGQAEEIGFSPPFTQQWRQSLALERQQDQVLLHDPALASEIFQRIPREFLVLPEFGRALYLNPRLRIYRYLPGGFFAPHQDGFYAPVPQQRSQLTLLIHLNDTFLGGELVVEGHICLPQTGQGWLYPHHCLHEGKSVQAGRKYVLRTDVIFPYPLKH